MTSNLPNMDAVRKRFRPEFINRIDEIVFFNELGKDVMADMDPPSSLFIKVVSPYERRWIPGMLRAARPG